MKKIISLLLVFSNINEKRWSSGFGSLNGARVLMNVRAQRVDEIFIFD